MVHVAENCNGSQLDKWVNLSKNLERSVNAQHSGEDERARDFCSRLSSSPNRGRQPESDYVFILAAQIEHHACQVTLWPQLFQLLSLPFLNEKERSKSSETLCCSTVDYFTFTCYPRVGNAALEARFRRADC